MGIGKRKIPKSSSKRLLADQEPIVRGNTKSKGGTHKELDAEIIRVLVERIDVFKTEKVPGTRMKKQTILNHWNFIGAVELPQEQKKSA